MLHVSCDPLQRVDRQSKSQDEPGFLEGQMMQETESLSKMQCESTRSRSSCSLQKNMGSAGEIVVV
jgi:hypothetical protein